ncbi:hypothetical protein L9F63_024970, partial [Diploptera punctata]
NNILTAPMPVFSNPMSSDVRSRSFEVKIKAMVYWRNEIERAFLSCWGIVEAVPLHHLGCQFRAHCLLHPQIKPILSLVSMAADQALQACTSKIENRKLYCYGCSEGRNIAQFIHMHNIKILS